MPAPKSYERFVLRHDTESSYATGGAPGSASKALMAFNAAPPQLNAEKRVRPFVAPYYGARPFLLAQKRNQFSFALEAQGSGTAGTAPVWFRPALDAGLAMVSRTTTAKVEATKRKVGTPVGDFTYTVTEGGTAKTMRRVTLECTTPGGTGVAEFTVSAPASGFGDSAENAYNQTAVVMTNTTSFQIASGSIISPTISVSFSAGDKFTIDIGPSRTELLPTSDRDNHDSGIFHYHMDDHRWVAAGARAEFGMDFADTEYARANFQYMTKYARPTDEALPTVDYSAVMDPEIVETNNTWLCELHGFACIMKSFSFSLGNQVGLVSRVGREEVRIGGRNVTGRLVVEVPELSAKNFFESVDTHARGALRVVHGTTPGKIIDVAGGAVQLDPLPVQNENGDAMFDIGLTFTPEDLTDGDDEIAVRAY